MLYDRKIKYLDYLENGDKVRNGGFVKIEAAGEYCNIQINITGLYPTDTFTREVQIGNGTRETALGNVELQSGKGTLLLKKIPLNSLGEEKIAYEELGHIRVNVAKNRELLCRWDDRVDSGPVQAEGGFEAGKADKTYEQDSLEEIYKRDAEYRRQKHRETEYQEGCRRPVKVDETQYEESLYREMRREKQESRQEQSRELQEDYVIERKGNKSGENYQRQNSESGEVKEDAPDCIIYNDSSNIWDFTEDLQEQKVIILNSGGLLNTAHSLDEKLRQELSGKSSAETIYKEGVSGNPGMSPQNEPEERVRPQQLLNGSLGMPGAERNSGMGNDKDALYIKWMEPGREQTGNSGTNLQEEMYGNTQAPYKSENQERSRENAQGDRKEGYRENELRNGGEGSRGSEIRNNGEGNRGSEIRNNGEGNRGSEIRNNGEGSRGSEIRNNGEGNRGSEIRNNGEGSRGSEIRNNGEGSRGSEIRNNGEGNRGSEIRNNGESNRGTILRNNRKGNQDYFIRNNRGGSRGNGIRNNGAGMPENGIRNNGAGMPENGIRNNGSGMPENGIRNNGGRMPENGIKNNGAGMPENGIRNNGAGMPENVKRNNGAGSPENDTGNKAGNQENAIRNYGEASRENSKRNNQESTPGSRKNREENREAPAALPNSGAPVKLFEDKWKQLSHIYPHISPFQDERDYLSIGPNDFVILQKSFHKLVNNSFLLHGFYNYDHLILARVSSKGEERFYVGVPGNFYDREKQVAIMFGFESFECKKEPAQPGDFGYYMIRVEL